MTANNFPRTHQRTAMYKNSEEQAIAAAAHRQLVHEYLMQATQTKMFFKAKWISKHMGTVTSREVTGALKAFRADPNSIFEVEINSNSKTATWRIVRKNSCADNAIKTVNT